MQSRRSYKTVAIQSSLFNIFRILRPKAEILLQKVFCRHHRRPLTGNAHDKRTNSKLQVCFTSDKNTPASFIYVLFPTIPFRLFSLSFPSLLFFVSSSGSPLCHPRVKPEDPGKKSASSWLSYLIYNFCQKNTRLS